METYNISLKEDGRLTLDNLQSDFLLLPANTIQRIGATLEKIVGPAVTVHLREIGRGVGQALVEVIRHEEKDLGAKSDIEAIAHYLEKAGFGKVKVEKHDDHFDILIELPPSLRYKAEGVQKCIFESGLIKGVMEALTGKKWKVEVDKNVNDHCCLIHLSQA